MAFNTIIIVEHIVNSVIFVKEATQVNKLCYRLAYKCSSTLSVYVR